MLLPSLRPLLRRLPASVKGRLRRFARAVGVPGATRPRRGRAFDLRLPVPPAGPGQASRPLVLVANPPRSIYVSVSRSLYVPRELEPTGLAGYDPDTLACFLAAAERPPIGAIFDVGANVGIFTLLACALTRHRVIAFEPEPRLAGVLRMIAADNDLSPVVEELALGATDGSATLFLSAVTDSSNSLLEGFRPARGSIEVTVRRMDAYCARSRTIPSLLKVDTEATEPDVLRGAAGLLSRHRPWIVCEVLAGREADLMAVMRPHDYAWYEIGGDPPLPRREEIVGDPEYRRLNWLFAPAPPPDLFWDRMAAWRRALADCGPA
jgi:FkbM family methyltransferase